MRMQMNRRMIAVFVALLSLASVCLPEAAAQQRRRNRPSRRITNPVRRQQTVPLPAPQSAGAAGAQNASDPTVVSTAEENGFDGEALTNQSSNRTRRAGENDPVTLRRTVNQMSAQITRLSDDLSRMKDEQRTMVNLERLTRAEQRAESLRSQLRDVTDKDFTLQERTAQIEYELEPDSIERRAAMVGTMRPGEVRDQIRRGLERERERVRAQLDSLTTSRTRLETAVANADSEVERLRARIDADENLQAERNANTTEVTPVSPPSTSPTPAQPPDNPPL